MVVSYLYILAITIIVLAFSIKWSRRVSFVVEIINFLFYNVNTIRHTAKYKSEIDNL